MQNFDFLVIGLGGVGSAVCAHLAERGCRVLGLEQFEFVHSLGSSHGESRVIRQAYFEHPNYVPLLKRAYELWSELEHVAGEILFRRCGVFLAGSPTGTVVPGALRSAVEHGIPIEEFSAEEAQIRFPQFRVQPHQRAVFEPNAGLLHVERCVRAYLHRADRASAALMQNMPVQSLRIADDHVEVQTSQGWFSARGAILAGGAWTSSLLPQLQLPLTVKRKCVSWFPTLQPERLAVDHCPAFLFEEDDGIFYGLPSLDQATIKLAEHTGGEVVTTPDSVDREVHPEDLTRLTQFAERSFWDVAPVPARSSVCLYTMTPDQNFLVASLPNHPHVITVAGLSGHGFKFASVLGEVAADLAMNQKSPLPVDFLSWRETLPATPAPLELPS